jgi:hypothetical protein
LFLKGEISYTMLYIFPGRAFQEKETSGPHPMRLGEKNVKPQVEQ